MANGIVAVKRTFDKPTFIYGLIDPRNNQLRYIGKTVLSPEGRTKVHRWRARRHPHKRHSMAWLLNLEAAGLRPEVLTIEVVPPVADWVEAEQFWIGYFRFIGADLCNHTIGGEGQTGYRQPPEMIAKRIKRGSEHPRFGKRAPPHVIQALQAGRAKFQSDPVLMSMAYQRRAPLTPQAIERANARREKTLLDNPRIKEAADAKRAASARRPTNRALVSAQSKSLWETDRERIIAAQNAGKSDEWKKKQSISKKQMWLDNPDNGTMRSNIARRKLSPDDVASIRAAAANGEKQKLIAMKFQISASMVSLICTGSRRKIP